MVLCICQAVTDREVESAIQAGARSLDEIAQRCGGAGTDCGCCKDALEERLASVDRPCANACGDCPRAARTLRSAA